MSGTVDDMKRQRQNLAVDAKHERAVALSQAERDICEAAQDQARRAQEAARHHSRLQPLLSQQLQIAVVAKRAASLQAQRASQHAGAYVAAATAGMSGSAAVVAEVVF